jgi:hypothetical protein
MHNNMPFSILVKYKGEYTIAIAQEIDNPINPVFLIKFPDGYKAEFVAIEDSDNWAESPKGFTTVAIEISPALNELLAKPSPDADEPYTITLNNVDYIAKPDQHTDQVFYHIYSKQKELCVLSINEFGEWEPNCEFDKDFAAAIGEQIMEHEG